MSVIFLDEKISQNTTESKRLNDGDEDQKHQE